MRWQITAKKKPFANSNFHTNSQFRLKTKQKKKSAPSVVYICERLTSFLCVCWWKRLYNVPPESLMMRTTRFSWIDQNHKTKNKKNKNKQPTNQNALTLFHCRTIHGPAYRSTGIYIPAIWRARAPLLSRNAYSGNKKLRFALSPPPPVSLMFYQWFFSFKSFIIKIIRQTAK